MNIEDLDFDDDFDESLPCSFTYIRLCLLLPAAVGFLNGFLWPAYALYFEEMGWPLVQAGLAVSVGFLSRSLMQQLQLRTGYWLIVPLSSIHLIVVILALIFQTNEWAVFFQIVVWLGIDPTCSVEGIAFDSFCESEVHARQAASTVLSVFTIAFACSCTLGGFLFDFAGWTGMGVYHISLQALVFLLLSCEPACWHSFMAVFRSIEPEEAEAEVGHPPILVQVVPAPRATEAMELPGVIEEDTEADSLEFEKQVQFGEDADEKGRVDSQLSAISAGQVHGNRSSGMAAGQVHDSRSSAISAGQVHCNRSSGMAAGQMHGGRYSAISAGQVHAHRSSAMTAGTGMTGMTGKTLQTLKTKGTDWTARTAGLRLMRRSVASGSRSRFSIGTKNSNASKASTESEAVQERLRRVQARKSFRSRQSVRSAASNSSNLSALSRFSGGMSRAGRRFQNHFAANRALLPQIVGARGRDSVQREELHLVDENGAVVLAEVEHVGAGVPRDLWLPAFCIMLNSFCNTFAYILVYAIFALYFKQVHHRADASLAGLTQMAGDVAGALSLQLVPYLFRSTPNSGCGRFWHCLVSKPYTLSVTLFTWIFFNLGMMTPWLPVTIAAQVLVGATFVYSCKWSMDMNLFYSMGDSQVFVSLQAWCQCADAIGGSMAGFMATWLYSLDSAAPFAFGAAMACLVWLIYTLAFCMRLGFGNDIETAENRLAA